MARQSKGVATTDTPEVDPPVYDERGNVRPKGTPGAVPMSYAERVAIATELGNGGQIVTAVEIPTATEEES